MNGCINIRLGNANQECFITLSYSSAAYSDKSNTCYSIQLEGVMYLELPQKGGQILSYRKQNTLQSINKKLRIHGNLTWLQLQVHRFCFINIKTRVSLW